MKKILYTLLSVNLFFLMGCEGFLDENPKSSKTAGDYYKIESQAVANVNYLYRNGAPRRISHQG